MRDTHPPTARALSVHLSLLPPPPPHLPPSVSATVMLSLSLCVCRQEVTQCLTESRQRDKLISQQTHRERERGGGEAVVGGGWRWEVGGGGGGVAAKTKQTKDRMPKLYSNTEQWGSG